MKLLSLLIILFATFAASAFASLKQPEIVIYPQPDSPLQISNVIPRLRTATDNKGQEWNLIAVDLVIQNVSSKIIRAYTIRQFEGEFNKDQGFTAFSFVTTANGLLRSKQTRNEKMEERFSAVRPESIKIAVDFVEFTDGTTWGADISKSAQHLAGIRAGARAFQEYLLEIIKQNGIEAAVKALDETKEISPSESKSEIWKSGFDRGSSLLKSRIKKAYEREGVKALEIELQKQFFSPI